MMASARSPPFVLRIGQVRPAGFILREARIIPPRPVGPGDRHGQEAADLPTGVRLGRGLAFGIGNGYAGGMNPDEIRELLRRDPFEPFRFHLTSGDTYEIRDPNSVALGERRVFVAFPKGDKLAFFPYLHIAAVETLGNGRSSRGKRRQ